MARRQRKSSSFFDIFRSCCSGGNKDEAAEEQPVYGRRIYASDEDRGYWVGEPGIDHRASDFIARFYESRRTDPGAIVY
ncbi:hypothetical protein RND81_14G076600 [Saponaria officinalis]|uniref:Uncharacterized protein n=1 Tax=Saponaria officinalis TaxID=3572 RepID=A0AAW1GME5_SAPOF